MEAAVFLNDDVIEQVLLRLPCKSLLRLRSVCKRWLSIIDDDFHFRHLHSRRNLQRPTAALFCLEGRLEVVPFSGDESRTSSLIRKTRGARVTPSCHGLVCLYEYYAGQLRNFRVLNPNTRERLAIPRPPNPTCFLDDESRVSFGFHPPTNKYVVFIMCHGHWHVFTLGGYTTSSWRIIKVVETGSDLHHLLPFYPAPAARFCYNGVLHWFSTEVDEDKDEPTLLTFDLGSEEILRHFCTDADEISSSSVDSTLEIDLQNLSGISNNKVDGFDRYYVSLILMIRDSGQTMDVYLPDSRDEVSRIWSYRRKWRFDMVIDDEEDEDDDHDDDDDDDVGDGDGDGDDPLCIVVNRTLICDEEGFRSQYHHRLLKKIIEENYYGDIKDNFCLASYPPVSVHAETLLPVNDWEREILMMIRTDEMHHLLH